MRFVEMLRGVGLGLGVLLFSSVAQAQVLAGVTPARVAVNLGQDEIVSLDWRLSGGGGGIGQNQARSDSGVLLDLATGEVLRVVPLGLATTLPGVVNEQLLLSRYDLDRAAALGFSQLAYRRAWRDVSGRESEATLRVALTSSQRTELDIRDLHLEFDQGQRDLRVVGKGEIFAARATISFVGRDGLLQYEWQLATPATARTDARYFVLHQGQQNLRGRSPFILKSPDLPTELLGPYKLRLVLRQPQDVQAELAYWVQGGHSDAALSLEEPLDGAVLSPGGVFRWRNIEQAVAYQLEVYSGDQRIAGVLLPAETEPSTALPGVSRQFLKAGCDCQWRVLAYDNAGDILTKSPMRKISIPPVMD